MNLNKPKFWGKKIGFFAILLFPLSLVFILLTFFKKRLSRERIFKIPIICIGNIYIGGTGKTPLSILLAKELTGKGRKPAILRKYYKDHIDEYNLIKRYFKDLIINNDRVAGLKEIIKSNYNIVILDDGLQDSRIKKDLKIVCFNHNQLIGNGLVLPAGPLRESLSALKNANIVIINGQKNRIFENKILKINQNLEIFYSIYKPTNLDQFKRKKLLAIAGIGNPENFFKLMEQNNLEISKKLIFPDHYQLSKIEIQSIINEAEKKNYQVIMTEKDYFKVNHFNFSKINYLKVSLEIEKKQQLLNKIEELYDKNN